MLLKLLQTGNPLLRKRAKPLTKQALASKTTQDVIDLMVSTLRDAPGVGLAAPQVGESLRIIIIEDKPKYLEPVPPELLKAQKRKPVPLKVLINPVNEIIDKTPALFFEGCLSVDGYLAAVPRATAIRVHAWDRHGNNIVFKATGWQARILQHEVDHLNGMLFIDRMRSKSFMSIKNFTLNWRKALPEKIDKSFKD